jgi:hypothetical protein
MTSQPILIETHLTDQHEVTITLDPEAVAETIVRALAGLAARGKLTLVRQLADDSPIRAQALRDVIRALDQSGALQVALTSTEAWELSEQIAEASYERESCARFDCDWLADSTGLCSQHQDAQPVGRVS